MTTFSPSTVGRVATRMSSMRPAAAAFSEIRPSCGLRRSAMSSFASTFRRVVTPGVIRFGIRCTSCSTPSTRKRTTSASSCGSKWTSEAPSSAAWKMTELTSRTSGASETPSSTSRSSSSSSSSPELLVDLLEDGARAERLRGARDPAQLDEDVLARGDAELERVARRQPQLVDSVQVARVGDGDPQRPVFERVRDRGDALEHVQRDLGGRLLVDAGERQVDERDLIADGERARDPLGRRDALVDDRLRKRALAGAAADERELVRGDEAGGGEQVDDQLGHGVDGHPGLSGAAAGRAGVSPVPACAELRWTLAVHIPRSSYRQRRAGA